jgi:hypothetical protein
MDSKEQVDLDTQEAHGADLMTTVRTQIRTKLEFDCLWQYLQ